MLVDELIKARNVLTTIDITCLQDLVQMGEEDYAREYEERLVSGKGLKLLKDREESEHIFLVHVGYVNRIWGQEGICVQDDTPTWDEEQVPVGQHEYFCEVNTQDGTIQLPSNIASQDEICAAFPESEYTTFSVI